MSLAVVEYHPVIKDLPSSERPRERLRDQGAENLSNAELLAIILRVGIKGENAVRMGERLLARFGGLVGLAKASFAELSREKGLGEAKAAQLKAALQIGRRLAQSELGDRLQVRSPADVANLLMPEMSLLEQEHLKVVLLNTKNQVIAVPEIYKGSLNTSQIRVGELFREAIRQNCAAIVVVHNHPSGDPTPSPEDIRVTEQVVEAGRLLDVEVLDHIVMGHQRFVSLKERGLGFR